MGKQLLIVESPAKAKTIEKYLGKDFVVKASYGHVRDLPKSNDAIDVDNGFSPKYEVIEDKKKIIKELKALVKTADATWLATDEDREGEAISWHLAEVLGLDVNDTKRIVYHEISKKAIQAAMDNPRAIDVNLVNAQQARRVLDRLVGFKLSPILWKKIKTGLSAGRVQSVAVRLIVEREREIIAFTPESAFKVSAEFILENGVKLKAELGKRFPAKEEGRKFLEDCLGADFKISNLETKPSKKSPSAPFITSTLQQEASRKLSFSVAQTMRVAQSLYENGHITYMRTDSVNLSDDALKQAQNVITDLYGAEYHQTRTFKGKTQGAQEAHEAIRPANLSNQEIEGDRNEVRLYELIWKRTVASQMADAKLEKATATIDVSTRDENLIAKGEVIMFEGFLKVYLESNDEDAEDDEQSGVLPPLNVGQDLVLGEMNALERFTRSAPRYTEASLVKKLEEQGIGRPSTYAPTISTIQKRNYVVKEHRDGTPRDLVLYVLKDGAVTDDIKTELTGAEKSKLFPTDLGMMVNDFLVEYFPNVLDYQFTAKVEAEFDQIAQGDKAWNNMISTFYESFYKKVEDTAENAERVNSERVLGVDPKTGFQVLARFGRFGPLVQLGNQEETEKPKYASLRNTQRLETITIEEAMDNFKLPRVLGEVEGQEIRANIGRFGPYVQEGGLFASVPKEEDVYDITFERAMELIAIKKEIEAKKHIATLAEDVQVLNGRWGPYIKMRGLNIKISKELKEKPETITLAMAEEMFEEQKDKPRRGGRKATAKKTTAKAKPKAKAKKKPAAKKKTAAKKTAAKKTATKKTAPKKK